MKVTDLNGHQIEVTDLDEAIRITTECKEYTKKKKNFSQLDRDLNSYWTDLHRKLVQLKKEQYEQPIRENGIQCIEHTCSNGKTV